MAALDRKAKIEDLSKIRVRDAPILPQPPSGFWEVLQDTLCFGRWQRRVRRILKNREEVRLWRLKMEQQEEAERLARRRREDRKRREEEEEEAKLKQSRTPHGQRKQPKTKVNPQRQTRQQRKDIQREARQQRLERQQERSSMREEQRELQEQEQKEEYLRELRLLNQQKHRELQLLRQREQSLRRQEEERDQHLRNNALEQRGLQLPQKGREFEGGDLHVQTGMEEGMDGRIMTERELQGLRKRVEETERKVKIEERELQKWVMAYQEQQQMIRQMERQVELRSEELSATEQRGLQLAQKGREFEGGDLQVQTGMEEGMDGRTMTESELQGLRKRAEETERKVKIEERELQKLVMAYQEQQGMIMQTRGGIELELRRQNLYEEKIAFEQEKRREREMRAQQRDWEAQSQRERHDSRRRHREMERPSTLDRQEGQRSKKYYINGFERARARPEELERRTPQKVHDGDAQKMEETYRQNEEMKEQELMIFQQYLRDIQEQREKEHQEKLMQLDREIERQRMLTERQRKEMGEHRVSALERIMGKDEDRKTQEQSLNIQEQKQKREMDSQLEKEENNKNEGTTKRQGNLAEMDVEKGHLERMQYEVERLEMETEESGSEEEQEESPEDEDGSMTASSMSSVDTVLPPPKKKSKGKKLIGWLTKRVRKAGQRLMHL